jgi:hypothetical protein
MLRAVAYRYGLATVEDMDYQRLKFWHRGHLELLAEENAQAERYRKMMGG